MEDFYESMIARAATIDELLSDAFEQLPGQKRDTDLAARRLAAWCRACASGDWSLFASRLRRDELSVEDVLARFATARRNVSVPVPAWLDDAVRIGEALRRRTETATESGVSGPVAFEQLLMPVVLDADALLWSCVDPSAGVNLSDDARACLRRSLLIELSNLAAPAIYERFDEARSGTGVTYAHFASDMRADGFRRLFDDMPVLLRLMASLTRQWIEASRELIARLDADLAAIRRELLHTGTSCPVTTIDGDLSDPHNFGRSVRIIGFEDGSRVVYKPKDLCVDAAWHALIERLNRSAPIDLRAVRVLPREAYGWTEFIDHTSCSDVQGFRQFFRRAGAWLALIHCFVGVDIHQENIIAAGEHPIPIDLEMILTAGDAPGGPGNSREGSQAFEVAMAMVNNSVMTVGLLPAYGKDSGGKIFAIGGVTSNSAPRVKHTWAEINSDRMTPVKSEDTTTTFANLPHVDGRRGSLSDHFDEFMWGFGDYAVFLREQPPDDLFAGFAGLTIRKVVRPTRYYYMLLQRLRDHRTMDDGIEWSAQADFAARLADWEHDSDPSWPLHRAERAALVELNVPHFVTTSDGYEIVDAAGTSVRTHDAPGLERARARVRGLSDEKIAWQAEVTRQSTDMHVRGSRVSGQRLHADVSSAPDGAVYTAEAEALGRTLSMHAIRKGPSAAWVGLDWLGDSEVCQLVVVGPDLYNGACGIALFLAALAAVTGDTSSRALAIAALSRLRQTLRGRSSAGAARVLSLGGGLGLGSIAYGLAVISELLDDDDILTDAHTAAGLITDEVISADRQLDVLGGSAGAILSLLRLYRQTGSADVLTIANDCGRHLLAQDRIGPVGRRTWAAPAFGRPLNGMSHGAAGFAYALAALASATQNEEFANAATECIAFEDSTFDSEHCNWSDLRRGTGDTWPCKWCYGAPGIGLARAAMTKHVAADVERCRSDIRNALVGAERGWPASTDTLCCGTLGSVEFLWEAGEVLGRSELRDLASRRLLTVIATARSVGDYRWSRGTSRFNLGLFRGVAGVGYTALRRVDDSLPNVLIWE